MSLSRWSRFLSDDDAELGNEYLQEGFVVIESESSSSSAEIQKIIQRALVEFLGRDIDLENCHMELSEQHLSKAVAHLSSVVAAMPSLNDLLFSCATNAIMALCGNQIQMQKSVQLSVSIAGSPQMNVASHADSWTGDSPFELVQWVPLTRTDSENTLRILSPSRSIQLLEKVGSLQRADMTELVGDEECNLKPILIKPGQILLFNGNCLHGTGTSVEGLSRWALNIRYSPILLTPLAEPDRGLGSYLHPVSMRAVLEAGLPFYSRLADRRRTG